MNKKIYKQIFGVLVVSVFIVPQIVLAAWWNPISWSIWDIFRPSPKVTQVVEIASTTSATPTATTANKVDTNAQWSALKNNAGNNKAISSEKPTQNQPITMEENGISQTPAVPVSAVATWIDLESKYFAEATQKGWTSLTITNVGEQRFYRLEDGTWVRKNTLAEAQQTYQPPLPPPTAAELQGVAYLCGIPQMASQCSTTFWSGYETNAIFRSNIDLIAQQLKQKLAQQATSQSTCLQASVQAYDPTLTPEANLYIQQSTLHACGLGPAPDQMYSQISQLQQQVQQLQTAQTQKQNTTTYVSPASPTQTKCTTQPWWDAGVLRFSTNCNTTNY